MSDEQPSKKTWREKQDEKIKATHEDHPAFVTVAFNRISGLRSFFGSAVKSHSWIRLYVRKAYRYHDLGHDHIHDSVKELVAVDLSPHQFAELLTTMGYGMGVPGTLLRMDGKEVEEYDEQVGESVRTAKEFRTEMESRAQDFREARNEVEKILAEKKTLSKADREQISGIMRSMVGTFTDSMPFYFDQFQEAMDKTVVQAKAEVDAFVSHVVTQTGLESLAEGKTPQFLLGKKDS